MSSDVSVPVLSKQHKSTCQQRESVRPKVQLIIRGSKDQQIAKWGTRDTTFPAKGILKGSVQNIPRRERASNDVLTAMDNSIGNSGGITEVMISEQPSKSLYLLRVGSSRPCKGTSINRLYSNKIQKKIWPYLYKNITSCYHGKYN